MAAPYVAHSLQSGYGEECMSDIQWILFSKHRTLQAASCVQSLTTLSDVAAEDITVLYVDSAEIDYTPLRQTFPCRFVRQTHFYNDVMRVVRSASSPFVSFLVDDLIFRERFSATQVSALLHRYSDLDAFSLRLGMNIEDGRPPMFKMLEPGVRVWSTTPGIGTSWNYFWELTGGIYRRATVLAYMEQCPPHIVTFPNPLESYYYAVVPNTLMSSRGVLATLRHPKYAYWKCFRRTAMRKRIACYEKSLAFTQGINVVADRRINYDTHITPQQLHALYLMGYRIDFHCLSGIRNTKPNPGRQYFRLVDSHGARHPLSMY